ncbi:efflux RND transporter periplasmic adaptor subunit [Pelovirga terrestris]|uniref:Efflux RND transporter periplasmic adaptor subunit n=1 Tax=Pelovirga terrestris TaxID=2771352 RepID=A0A8J6QP79_9BACT|nr:efflux RND transporter periplasmic adaptor subunit [Pelovirga terrestris]MBD1399235.1 efflux RND transporter periplasmic adaptor subunit [Pelovirga terrestris]
MRKLSICVPLVLSLVLLLISGCDSPPPVTGETDNQRRVNVVTQSLVPVDLTETFTLPARVQARDDLTLSAEVAGTVVNTPVREGMRVVQGQVLIEIDSSVIRAQLERETENVAVLMARRDRMQRLATEGLVSQQELEDVNNGLTAAHTGLEQARIQLNKTTLRSPIDGMVDRRLVDVGEYVDPGKPLLRLISIEQLEVIADVPEKDVGFLKPGQLVTITPAIIHGDQAEPLKAIIEYIAFVADEVSRTYHTRMIIEQPGGILRPGMIARATFIRQEHRQALVVPLFSVLDRRNTKIAYIVEDGYAREVEVVTGSSVGRQLVVRSGLEAGQQLVIKGQQLLIDGVAVNQGEAR